MRMQVMRIMDTLVRVHMRVQMRVQMSLALSQVQPNAQGRGDGLFQQPHAQ